MRMRRPIELNKQLRELGIESAGLWSLARSGKLRSSLRHALRNEPSYNMKRAAARPIARFPKIQPVSLRALAPNAPDEIRVEHFSYYDNSMPLVDVCALVALVAALRPERVLEIGTSDGFTAASLAAANETTSVLTVDIADEVQTSTKTVPLPWGGTATITSTRRMGQVFKADDNVLPRVRFLRIEPMNWQPDEVFDLIFIDGAHDYRSLEYDTRLALDSVSEHGMIAWHDFDHSPGAKDVPRFLERLSRSVQLLHVEGTSIVVHDRRGATRAGESGSGS
jgi:predicted O-methyltransferase YrrM